MSRSLTPAELAAWTIYELRIKRVTAQQMAQYQAAGKSAPVTIYPPTRAEVEAIEEAINAAVVKVRASAIDAMRQALRDIDDRKTKAEIRDGIEGSLLVLRSNADTGFSVAS